MELEPILTYFIKILKHLKALNLNIQAPTVAPVLDFSLNCHVIHILKFSCYLFNILYLLTSFKLISVGWGTEDKPLIFFFTSNVILFQDSPNQTHFAKLSTETRLLKRLNRELRRESCQAEVFRAKAAVLRPISTFWTSKCTYGHIHKFTHSTT